MPTTEQDELLSIQEASTWASSYMKRVVTESNISYLIQYGRIQKIGENGTTQIIKSDLIKYYEKSRPSREMSWKKTLGDDLNWSLSFEQYRESETTKHVHRLHPYKGKYIPQLVEYFLDDHTDNFKKKTYFKKEDIILDPFCGSGTTLVQANELGMHSIGIDISAFNSLISNIKIGKHDFEELGKSYPDFSTNAKTQKIKSIFSKLKNWIFNHFQFIILKTQHEHNFAI